MAEDVTWEADARTFLDAIMTDLPFFVRSHARAATSEEAVLQVGAEGGGSVTRHHVVMAMIAVTPGHMMLQLRAMLEKRGVDMGRYGGHFG